MGQTMIEKILSNHAGQRLCAGEISDIAIDIRAARDFGGPNVVKNINAANLGIEDPRKTIFTFDCYPGATDARYATNQQICRVFAEERGIRVSDIQRGIGTHVAIDEGLVAPGETFISTDSHANIIGAIGGFGQGMGDQDIAHAFAFGTVWFKVPKSVKVILKGMPGPEACSKDVSLAMLRHLGANGLLGYSAEIGGPYAEQLPLAGRITISSQATEMGAIIALFAPNSQVLDYCSAARGERLEAVLPDADATYDDIIEIDIEGLAPMIARPGHPEDVVALSEVAGRRIHSAFIGSCTNGRYEDMREAADVLKGREVDPGVVLKIVPSTDSIWRRCLENGIIAIFKEAGALVSNAGCAGCAAGQVGQNGPGEVTVSTGNRNYTG
ncbi:MAG: homoaconitate hydratase, partial [Candidatus Eisenbacteria sp.]|nr:homoaconitate hydratase [Candidatus Eisenbacteria bacterium]